MIVHTESDRSITQVFGLPGRRSLLTALSIAKLLFTRGVDVSYTEKLQLYELLVELASTFQFIFIPSMDYIEVYSHKIVIDRMNREMTYESLAYR